MRGYIMKKMTIKHSVKQWVVGLMLLPATAFAQTDTGVVNLVTTEAGLHRITYEQLAQQGVDLNGIKKGHLAISHAGEPVARYVGGDKLFGDGSYIDFVAGDASNRYTDETVYTLHIDKQLKQNIRSLRYRPGGEPTVVGTTNTVLADNNNYGFTSANLEDPWSMDYIYANKGPVSKTYTLDLPDLAAGEAVVTVVLSGASNVRETPDHSVVVAVNDSVVTSRQFDGFSLETLTASIDASLLNEQANTVTITLPLDHSAPYDIVAVESVAIEYQRDLQVENDDIEFSSSAGKLRLTGFSEAKRVNVYQQLESGAVNRLPGNVKQARNGELRLNVSTGGQQANYFVYDDQGIPTPVLRNLPEKQDITSGEAQYLVIANAAFIGSELERLVQLRQATYSVKVVDVEQVYMQFGRFSAEADPIKAYIDYAVENMATEMIVLVGGDTYDYLGYRSDSVSHLPTLYKVVDGGNSVITHSPSDAAFGDLDEDGIPDIPVGRLPVRTVDELRFMINKIVTFEQRDYAEQAVFAADKTDNGNGYSFVPDAEDIIGRLPQPIQQDLNAAWQTAAGVAFDDKKAFIELDGAELSKDKLISAINEGAELTSYLGHSNMFKWSTDLFDTQDALALNNVGRPTVMTQYGCWNTYYVLPTGNSLAQVLLLSGDQGAATVLGSSTLTLATSEAVLGQALHTEMYIPGKTIGAALVDAKRAIASGSSRADVLLGWQIMGDPAIVMNPAN